MSLFTHLFFLHFIKENYILRHGACSTTFGHMGISHSRIGKITRLSSFKFEKKNCFLIYLSKLIVSFNNKKLLILLCLKIIVGVLLISFCF